MRLLLLGGFIALIFGSCTINKDILFKTPQEYTYDTFPDSVSASSVLTANNILTFSFFTGNGHMLVEQGLGSTMLSDGGGQQQQNMAMQRNMITYLIDSDGTAKLPVIGRVHLAGLTLREAEKKLEELYLHFYNEPFVIMTVENNRVIVSPGGGGTAQVINLINNNTTLLEALAMVGGVNDRGNAGKVKLIRYDKQLMKRAVYEMDLSTIDGLAYADIIIQPNDIIYVEPLPLIAREIVTEIAPVVTLLTATLILITILTVN